MGRLILEYALERIGLIIRLAICAVLCGIVALALLIVRPGHSHMSRATDAFPSHRPAAEDSVRARTVADIESSDLLWSGSIPLARQSAETLQNVIIAADAVDLTVVHPHEIFSFNKVVGVRTQTKGYEASLMYENGKVVSGVGGGICIVATSLYNAALNCGLKIVEREHHSGRVSFAEPGLDSAVAFGSEDLAFKNNTGAPIHIRCVVQNGELVTAFYGRKRSNLEVKVFTKDYVETPYQVFMKEDPSLPDGQLIVDQKAATGYDVTTMRIFKVNGQLVSTEEVSHDTVAPRDKVIRLSKNLCPALQIPTLEPLPPLPSGLLNQQRHPARRINPAPASPGRGSTGWSDSPASTAVPDVLTVPDFSLPSSDHQTVSPTSP